MNKFTISAIVCAAGLSKRMGQQNKTLLPYQNKPLILHTIEQLVCSQINEVIVVTGHDNLKVENALHSLSAKISIVKNEHYLQGQTSSIQKGIKVVSPSSDAFMICLADMPLLLTAHYNHMIDSFEKVLESVRNPIVRPTYKKRPGHPVIMHSLYAAKIMSCNDKDGCRSVITSADRSYVPIETEEQAYFCDIDTPKAYKDLIAKNLSF